MKLLTNKITRIPARLPGIMLMWTLLWLLMAAGCDTIHVDLVDTSKVTGVKLVFEDNDETWLVGEKRTLTVEVKPGTAVIGECKVFVSDEALLSVSPTEVDNEFTVEAMEGGRKSGEVYAGIWAEVDGVKSDVAEFCLIDKRPVPKAPEFKLYIAGISSPGSKTAVGSVIKTEYDAGYMITFELEDKTLNESTSSVLSIEDTEIATLTPMQKNIWQIKSVKPGETKLELSIEDGDGNSFAFEYIYVVFGHIWMDADFFVPFASAGYELPDYVFESSMAHITLVTEIKANIEDGSAAVISKTVETSIYAPIDDEDNIMMQNCSEAINAITSRYALDSKGNKCYYRPKEAHMSFVFSLDNPYIIIDRMTDDRNRSESKYSDIVIYASFQQEGVAQYNE